MTPARCASEEFRTDKRISLPCLRCGLVLEDIIERAVLPYPPLLDSQ